MAEAPTGEKLTPNFLKTERAQREHAKAFTEKRGFLEKLSKYRDAHSKAEYQEGSGGSVSTSLTYGNANMYKSFGFDKNGDLRRVTVRKNYRDRHNAYHPVLDLELNKDNASGDFKITRKTSGNAWAPLWEKEFKRVVTEPSRKSPEPQRPAGPTPQAAPKPV